MGEKQEATTLKQQGGRDATKTIAEDRGRAAKKIITLARKNGVPVDEDRNLIELLSTIGLYEEMPAELYKAVAGILAYIYRMSGKQ